MSFKTRNFMTPIKIREYTTAGGLFVEFSKGEGFERDTMIYGVTIGKADHLEAGYHVSDHDLSKGGFSSIEDAEAYVKSLKPNRKKP